MYYDRSIVMGRRYYKNKTHCSKVLKLIADNYYKLRQILCPVVYGNYSGRSIEDIFSDTILLVSQDDEAVKIEADDELLKYFGYRFRMVEFQTINDSRQAREIAYADYLRLLKDVDGGDYETD